MWRNVDFGHDLAVTGVAWSLIWESIADYVFDTEGSLPYEAPTLRRLEDKQAPVKVPGTHRLRHPLGGIRAMLGCWSRAKICRSA